MYYSGVYYVATSVFAAICKGIVKEEGKEMYDLLLDYIHVRILESFDIKFVMGFYDEKIDYKYFYFVEEKFQPLFENPSTYTSMIVFEVWIYFHVIWFFLCWGAYRNINSVGRIRSLVSFIFFTIMMFPIGYVLAKSYRGIGLVWF
jgi:hypothetical protein